MTRPTPRADEDYDDFMERCLGDGNSEEECELQWENEAAAARPAVERRRAAKAFYGTPWAILPEKLAEIRAVLAAGNVYARLGDPRDPTVAVTNRVAVIPVCGVLCQRADWWGETSCEAIGQALDRCVADKSCTAIVMLFDSPGGSVFGIAELADRIYQARDQKPIVGLADPMAASAAYWLASQCTELSVAPSGMVGSIGCIAEHDDCSRMLEQMGVKVTLITAGKYKGEGDSSQPLSEDARGAMQEMVDSYYGTFVAGVARGRGVREAAVRAGYGQGRVYTADKALAAGMVDKIATLADVLGGLGVAPAGGPAAQDLRRKLDLASLDD